MIIFIANSSYDFEPATSQTRSDARNRIRNYLYEQGTETVKLWTDAQLNDWMFEEVQSWWGKSIYNPEVMESVSEDGMTEFDVPDRTIAIDLIEIDYNNGATPRRWSKVVGWKRYGGKVILGNPIYGTYPLRMFCRRQYQSPAEDSLTLGITDAQMEVLVAGVCLRAYRALMGYFVDAKNWDAVAKPDGISFNQVQNWYRMLKEDYEGMVRRNKRQPTARDIDLTG